MAAFNGFHEGPESCFTCQCIGIETVCSNVGSSFFAVGEDSGECPPSEYADFTDFTVTKSPCKSIGDMEMELGCGSNAPGKKRLRIVTLLVSLRAAIFRVLNF
jgi:hypothetical protein